MTAEDFPIRVQIYRIFKFEVFVNMGERLNKSLFDPFLFVQKIHLFEGFEEGDA